ncbi:MAG: hypothetical protein LBS33_04340, partial [Streptococcaceae bacterium]|nr:hypothetical protein [Streptococcaceae bacterium]
SVPFNRNGVTRFDNAKWLILEDDTTNHKAKIIRTTPLTYEEAGVTQPVAGGDGDDATGTGTDASAMLTFLPASNEYLTYFDSDGNNNYGKTGDGGFAISPVRKAVENYYANMTNTADKARVLAIKQDCPSFSDFSDGLSSEQGFKVRTGDDSVTPTNWERSLKFSSLDARYKTVLATNGGTLTAFVPTLGDIVASSLEIEDTGKGYYLLGATTLNTWLASPGKQDDNVAALAGMNGRVVIFSEVPLVNDSSFFPFSVHPALWISY